MQTEQNKQAKKLLIMNIYEVLKRHSDEKHTLSQKEIAEKLEQDFGMTADRKAIKRNLMCLKDMGYDIRCKEIERRGGEEVICSEWYLEPEFTEGELRLLIDSLLNSKHIKPNQCRDLIDKLCGLHSEYFSDRMKHVSPLSTGMYNTELFLTIERLDEAIESGKQVAFIYNNYGTDMKLRPRREEKYIVSPYRMVTANGRYYLICCHDKYDDISYYRVDKITGVEPLEILAKPLDEKIDLPRHLAEHIYMFPGRSIDVKFRADKLNMGDLMDWFGAGMKILSEDDGFVTVRVKVNEESMHCWALQYGRYVEVLEPISLRNKIAQSIRRMAEKYGADSAEEKFTLNGTTLVKL